VKKLGRGLSELGLTELLGDVRPAVAVAAATDQLHHLPVESLNPGQYQPRRHMDQAALVELADSIRAQGILQPLIVRARPEGGYEIVAGERRWRAAILAGLTQVPAIVRRISDQTATAYGLIENIQRRDLTALEEAQALQRLLQEFQLTHEAVAQAVGKSRAAITNLLRLLQLNDDVKQLLADGQLEKGHALVLLALSGTAQSHCAQQAAAKHLSVRQTEVLVQQQQSQPLAPASVERLEATESQQNLSEKLGAKVAIRHNARGKGKIVIHYHNLEELAGILAHIQ
jgi:ParB family transcriptional regulator, chromosome partitioning protein